MKIKNILILSVLVVSSFNLLNCDTDWQLVYPGQEAYIPKKRKKANKLSNTRKKIAKPSIGAIAMSPEQKDTLGTLVTAVLAADPIIAEVLQGKTGPKKITVFAPTNDAFAKIPADQLKALLADKEKLSQVLKYHVVKGNYPAKRIVNLDMLTTLEGLDVTITTDEDGNVFINDSKVITADIKAGNGTVHLIDTVLMPS